MKRILLIVFVALSQFGQAQDLCDINTLREITIKLYEPDYHQTLIDWFNADDDSRLAACRRTTFSRGSSSVVNLFRKH